jgi:hypothetical protein
LNGRDWVKSFISELVAISHTQWVFHNITLHDKRQGFVAVTRKKELIAEIEKLHSTPIDDIPTESKFLLDCNLDELKAADNTGSIGSKLFSRPDGQVCAFGASM